MTEESQHTRRGFLAGVGSIFGTALVSEPVLAQKRAARQMVLQKSQPFEGNYEGQFVIIATPKNTQVSPSVIGNCKFPEWKPKQTQVYDGVLVDRLGDSPQSQRTNVFMDGTKRTIRVGQPFIINNVISCSAKYAGLEAQSIPPSATKGKPPGPTVPGTDEGQQGGNES